MARSTLQDFVIKDKLGSGSFGAVYKVSRKQDRQTYALKEVDLQGMSRKEQEECIKETLILSSLDSEFIVKYYDSFLEKGKLYICMEYAAGGNLHDFIKRQKSKLPEELIWRLFIQMLLGLHHMHKRKVLHRDIKTLNMLLDDKLNVRLGDLGVAKVLTTNTNFAKTVVGTPYYLSPEMCEDKPYNQKSDVWAIGVSLYECCTQKHPFDADNQGALILKILRGRYPAVSGYSKDLAEVVKACLTLDVRKRPDTITLLGMKAVRERAAELGLEDRLPPTPTVAKPVLVGIAPHLAPHLVVAAGPGALTGGSAAVGAAVAKRPSSLAPGNFALAGIVASRPTQMQDKEAGSSGSSYNKHGNTGSVSSMPGVTGRPVSSGAVVKAANNKTPGGLIHVAEGGPSPEQLQLQSLSLDDSPLAGSGLGGASPAGPVTPVLTEHEACDEEATPPSSDRSHHMREAIPTLKRNIIEQVGARSFEALHMLINMTAEADAAEAGAAPLATGDALVLAVQRIIPESKVAVVLPLMFKLMYLESQIGE